MQLKNIILYKSDKSFRINTYFTYIFALIAIIFFLFPAYFYNEGNNLFFLIAFIAEKEVYAVLYVILFHNTAEFVLNFNFIFWIVSSILFDVIWIINVVFLFKTLFSKKIIAKKQLFFCFCQIFFAFGLLGHAINKIFNELIPIQHVMLYSHLIIAIISIIVAVVQLIHFIYILKNIKQKGIFVKNRKFI